MFLNELKNEVVDNVNQKYHSTDDNFADHPPEISKGRTKL